MPHPNDLPVGLDEALAWLEQEHQLFLHNMWKWPSTTQEGQGPHPYYACLSTPRLNASNKVYTAGRGASYYEALSQAWSFYLNPPTFALTKISKKEISLSLEDLDL